MISLYRVPIGTTFNAHPQSDYFGPATVIGAGGGSTIRVQYQNGRCGQLSLLSVERAHKGAIPKLLLSDWRDADGRAI